VLPVAIMSTCFVTCNPRSLMAFLSLRTSDAGVSHPQAEIEQAAKQCEDIFSKLFPITHGAFNENGRVSP
jgi:thymidylate synthase (FAD)